LRAAIGFSRRVTSAGGRLLFFQPEFNLLLHIMHLFRSDRPPQFFSQRNSASTILLLPRPLKK
jgi:hypothetical protein